MTLQPENQGVWVSDSWKPGMPGTFAVIVGISAYQHLDGSPEKFRLGQLFVSALTAFKFLDWLKTDYRRTGSPLAKCWLLLSPTAAELKANPLLLQQSSVEPTFDRCSLAIQQWFGEMAQLSRDSAARSRSVFFFSGHGLEVVEDYQVLLPSDYLRPGTPIDRAISTSNISRGLKALYVPTHFLFLDACRNDHDNLGQYTPLQGTKILNEPSNKALNPDCLVPIFYGSAAGEQVFSPKSVDIGLSLLGQALLEGLRASGLKPDCSSGTCYIDLHLLRPFVQNRIAEVVRTVIKKPIVQRVRVRGDQTEDPVTEVVPPPTPPSGEPPPAPPPLSDFVNLSLAVRPARASVRPTTISESIGHEFFGSERVTAVWRETARVFEFETEQWLTKGDDLEISALRRTTDASSFQFDMTILSARPGVSYWLQIQDEKQAYGCALPLACVTRLPDQRQIPTKFRIEMDFSHRNHIIDRFEISLSPDSHSEFYLESAAAMWRLYEDTSAREAEKRYGFLIPQDADMLRELVRYKHYSPFAATIAATILVRARRWDKLTDWVRNLANIRPYKPDAQVLWIEQCMRERGASARELLQFFSRLARLPLPVLSETLGYLLRQIDDSKTEDLGSQENEYIGHLGDRLRHAVGFFRTGGLFATFAGPEEEIVPDLVTRSQQRELAYSEVAQEIGELPAASTFADEIEAAEEEADAKEEDDAEAGV